MKKKARTWIYLPETYKNITSSSIVDMMKTFLKSPNKELLLNIKEKNNKYIKKTIILNDRENEILKKFQELAKKNKISPKTLLRVVIENYHNF